MRSLLQHLTRETVEDAAPQSSVDVSAVPLSDCGPVSPSGLSHAQASSWSSHDGAARASRLHASLFTDVEEPVESPTNEPDEADVLNELLSGSHVAGGSTVPTWIRPRPESGSYSSYRSWRPSQDSGQSANPIFEVADSLRSVDSLSLVSNAPSSSSSPTRPETEDQIVNMAEQQVTRGQRQGNGNKMDASLPDDDGMRDLRVKLHEIRTLAASTEEKAKRMHYLMTQDYEAHRASTPGPMDIDGTSKLAVDPQNPYNVQPADLEATFSPLPARVREGNNDESMAEDIIIQLGLVYLPPLPRCLFETSISAPA
ncbi:hypothetical protein LTR27_005519 [Elasticomyces elasticus]|nr:hypothetical protein LTR27_005519 [Elasticomyces elasticus]